MGDDSSNNVEGEPGYVKLSAQGLAYQLGPNIKGSSNLFKGLFNKKIPIALKRYEENDKDSKEYQRNLEFLSSPENRHPNLTRYFGQAVDISENSRKFNYLAVEWCEYSVADLIPPKIGPQKSLTYRDEILNRIRDSISNKEILRQSSEAVSFLHGLGMIHRQIKPDNFLISCVDPNKDQYLIKITDYKLLKNIDKNPIPTPIKLQDSWAAPESFKEPNEYTNKSDAFVMGCYYYYVLCQGNHPFGDISSAQKTSIKDQCYNVYKSDWTGGDAWNKAENKPLFQHEEEATWALDMIKELIKFEPLERKSVEDVLLKSKYFQPETYQIYDHPEAKIPGLCVIITQEKNHNPKDDRNCLNIDSENLSNTFSSFGYDILPLKNLDSGDIISCLSPKKLLEMLATRKKTKPSFKDYASLVVCFLGHGNQGVVTGVNNVGVPLNIIQYETFDDEHCPDLSGKPKVFIILACQGNKSMNKGTKRKHDDAFPSPSSTEMPTSSNEKQEEGIIPPVFDFIRLMATIEGYKARGGQEGSPFINSLCKAMDNEYKEVNRIDPEKEKDRYELEEKKILKKNLGKRDLTQLFTTFVTPVVGSDPKYWQTPEFRSSLSKTIKFRRIIRDPVDTPIKPYYDGEIKGSFIIARANYTKKKPPN